jgi:HSP20 family protein
LEVDETEQGYNIEAEVPGVAKENIKIEVAGRLLTVSIEKKDDKETSDAKGSYRQRFHSFSSKSIQLPKNVDANNVDATCADGILRIGLKKTPEVSPVRIDIK